MVRPGAPTSVHLHCAPGVDARALARMLDSLVRVSRRVAGNHYASILAGARSSAPGDGVTRRAVTVPGRDPHSRRLPPVLRADAGPPATEGSTRVRRRSGHGRVWSQALPFQQFHVLFDSLSKVLFIFRSLYLCAIGLWPVFSFR